MFKHWKSTFSGVFSCAIASSAWLAVNGSQVGMSKKVAGMCLLISGVGKLWIGLISKDATDSVLAKVPGVAEPIEVPAHQLPDDPSATAVIPQPK